MHLRIARLFALMVCALSAIAPPAALPGWLEPLFGAGGSDARAMQAHARTSRQRKQVMIPERLVIFKESPFPFEGTIPGDSKPFLEKDTDGRLFHQSPRGGKLYLDETYNDPRSLIYASRAFDPSRKEAVLLLFFHGNESTLDTDVVSRQAVPRQLAESRLNAVLVAPQMAVNARDSTAGRFYEPGFFETYLAEAARHIAELSHSRVSNAEIDRLPVVIVAYSGGYVPTIVSLQQDLARAPRRVVGVVLLDAFYGEEAKFEGWIAQTRRSAFFVSAYSQSTAGHNLELRNALEAGGVDFDGGLPDRIKRGTIAFQSAPDAVHKVFLTEAWVQDPLALILRRVRLGREGGE